jgi:hypothetical protein
MGDVSVKLYNKEDIPELSRIIVEAWRYYVQEIEESRVKELLEYYLTDDTARIWLAFEDTQLMGVAHVFLKESFRSYGEEGRLELLYIRDTAANYYDIHTSLMNSIFEYLRKENIEFLRVDTTLENSDVLFV